MKKYAVFNKKFEQLTGFEFDIQVNFNSKKEVYVFVKNSDAISIRAQVTEKEIFDKYQIKK